MIMRLSRGAVLGLGLLGAVLLAANSRAYGQDERFVRGEINQDNNLDVSDVVSILFHLFQPDFEIPCERAADVNDSGSVDVSDPIYELAFFYQAGPAPAAPYPACGIDPSPDGLSCDNPPCAELTGSVIISEIMAANAETLFDADGDSPDWVELHLQDTAPDDVLDLGGYFLTTDEDNLREWRIPDGVTIERGGFLLFLASGKDREGPGDEIHTNFQLDKDGEYFALVAPDGATIVDSFDPAFPEQLSDVSFGLAQSSTTLVAEDHPVRYLVPRSGDAGDLGSWADRGFSTAGWESGTSALGFSRIATEGFDVTYYKANIQVGSLATAESVISNPARQSTVRRATAEYIDYRNTDGFGNYSNNHAFPGIGFSNVDDFVILVTGTILIPQAGPWSFGVNSDDGFGLDIDTATQSFRMEHAAPRGPSDTIQTFNFSQAGPAEIRLVYYERGGGAGLEFFAAQGSHASFSNSFDLVGDTAIGGLALLGFASSISTNIEDEMKGRNASLWARYSFDVDEVADLAGLAMRIRYADGFVAYINGTEVARRNAPANLSWNSRATRARDIEDAPTPEEINLTNHLGRLVNGSNVLAVHALNNTSTDGDFLIGPELIAAGRAADFQYMTTPTPGTFNVEGVNGFVRKVEFNRERGFYDASFQLTLSTITQGAQIRYTTNGVEPTATTGTVYSGPLNITRTTVIRAAAFRSSYIPSQVSTRSFFFTSDIVRQSPTGARPGSDWPNRGRVNGQVIDYGMDPDVVNHASFRNRIEDGLLQIKSISLVTDIDNFFDSSSGIYVNARADGRSWERACSVELLDPDGGETFQVGAGVRIRGAFSRSGDNPKHSLRLFFRRDYGDTKLRHPMFEGHGVDEFDAIDLRTSQNWSWAFSGSDLNTFIREVFSRDVQRDVRKPHTRSRYYHLYLNGVYWGLFQTQERVNREYAQSYFGGNEDDFDVIKNNSSGNRALEAADGNMSAYRALYDAAVAGFSSNTAYMRIQGLRSDGTDDPARPNYLDPENLMDYMACTYLVGDPDAPISAWAHFSNNIFAVYNRVEQDGFKWFRHDAEHSLGSNGGLNEGRLLTDATDRRIGQNWSHFNPAWLHLRLTANAEYAIQFADLVNDRFHHGGALSPQANIRRWRGRSDSIDLAVIGPSARWGDAKRGSPRTKNDWDNQTNYMVGTYFPQRTQIVLNQMRSVNMFPREAIVSFNRHGGHVDEGFRLSMTQSNGTPGTIYYAFDGVDPRMPGGAIHPDAEVFTDDTNSVALVELGAVWRYLDNGSNQGTAWRTNAFNHNGWPQGGAPLGYGDGDETTEVGFGPDEDDKYATTYFRRRFNASDVDEIVELTLGLVRDDGAVVYLNGTEIVRSNMPGGEITYLTNASGPGVPVGGADESAVNTFDIDPGLLIEGSNVLAVSIHQVDGTSSDISFDASLTALTAGDASDPLTINSTTTVRARVRNGARWGAMTEARFLVGLNGLVINEFMADNNVTLEDPDEAGEFPDWVEIYNGTDAVIDLGGMYLTDDPLDLQHWQFTPGTTIGPGEHLIVYADDDGTQGPLHTNYQLSDTGEYIGLVDVDGETVLDEIFFERQISDVSYGRFPDGSDTWGYHPTPTPHNSNLAHAP